MPPDSIDWRKIVPEDWQGECVVCHAPMNVLDWKAQNVIAAPVGDVLAVAHASHGLSYEELMAAQETIMEGQAGG